MLSALSQREQEILRLLSEDSGMKTTEIGRQLNVSAVTVRSDLNSLAEKGYIVRTRGGALPTFHPAILERQRSMVKEKLRIAKAAADLVSDGDSMMIVAGTTTSMIPKFLMGKVDVHVVTNSTLLLPSARINPCLKVTLVGGEFLPSAEAMVGPITLRELEQFHVKWAFVGTDGFSLRYGITANMVDVAEVVKKVAAQADQVVLVADSAKYGKAGFAHILPLTRINKIITDLAFRDADRKELEDSGIAVVTV